jgi:hypothetical protein
VHLLCLNVITPRLAYMDDDQKLLVVAIDFGSTTAGYAFSFRHEYTRNPLESWTSKWKRPMLSKLRIGVILDILSYFEGLIIDLGLSNLPSLS